jgi:hypothetical protein
VSHEPHRRTRCGFANRFSIHKNVLVALDEMSNELRRDELDVISESSQLAGHMVGSGTRFHHNHTRMECDEELDELLARQLHAKHRLAGPALAVKMKRVFAQINPNQRHVLHDGLLKVKTPD